ncbi:MAG: NAD(P)(+) transhydrogenase (Re/Si-specific) subunit alpha, partial [Actinomycetota bacterium]|nr:NAD(P)(+) transhydrogenase (Re/Si-specific) subunit alpha [Actinomycetota bacterium]
MKIGVPREVTEGERRVGLVPETIARLVKDGFEVLVETGAGRDYNLD